MTYRTLAAGLFAAVLVLLGRGAPAAADDKDHVLHGHVVKVAESKLTVAGEDKKEVTLDMPKEAKVTIDGKDAKLADLKPHTHVKVTMKEEGGKHVVTKVEADTKK